MGEELKTQKLFRIITIKHWRIWIKIAGIIVLIVLLLGLLIREYKKSQVWGSKYRYNLALASESGKVAFVSFDPEEKQIFVIPYPDDLEIKSRSVGEYRIGNLFKLGEYTNEGGEFVRRKMQGFMRVPILGYLILNGNEKNNIKSSLRVGLWKTLLFGGKGSSMSKLDAGLLVWRMSEYAWKETSQEELARAGIIENADNGLQYRSERLKQYLVLKVFDWVVGETNVTVTVINASGENGLGSDTSEFLRNMGFDVVAVRGSEDQVVKDISTILIEEKEALKHKKILELLNNLFHFEEVEIGSTVDHRSEFVITLGRDAISLF